MTTHEDAKIPASSAPAPAFGGIMRVPGDKSISHRALMLSSQVLGTTRIHGLLEGEDVLATARALRALGVHAERLAGGGWEVNGVGPGGLAEPTQVLDMGNAGTGCRLLMGLLAPYPFLSVFCGDASLSGRPMGRVIAPLSSMGARFLARREKYLPLAMLGAEHPLPVQYRLPVASAQVKSAILLAGMNTPGVTSVVEPSPTRDHTERMLGALGFPLTRGENDVGEAVISIAGHYISRFEERAIYVPADPSSAAFPLVAALIAPEGEATLERVCVNPTRTGLIATLREMGADIALLNEREEAGEPIADIRARASRLTGVEVPTARAPSMIDEYPILAVAAACAKGKTVMRGLGELRVKESDRLQAIADGLAACGVKAEIEGDALTVHGAGGPPPGGGAVTTHFDHRIAMSFLVLGLAARDPVTVDDSRAIATSFPGFLDLMNKHGARMRARAARERQPALPVGKKAPRRVIAIDGPAASGKGTLARRLARHYGYGYLDTGSLYRAVALRLVEAGLDAGDMPHALAAAEMLQESDLGDPRLRREEVGQAASIVSADAGVRRALLAYQRRFAKRKEGAILDGRDIGTVVCPEADVKLFLTADLEARARRRRDELQEQGIEVVHASVLRDLRDRDARDAGRTAAPLVAAQDAITLDTTDLSADEVFAKALQIIEKDGVVRE